MGLAIKYIQTGELGDFKYGEYALFISITTIALIIFRFGIFVSLQTLLANNNDEQKERELLGAGLLMTFVIGLLFSLALLAFSPFVNELLNTELGYVLSSFALLAMVLPFQNFVSAASTGTNRIKLGAFFNFLPKVIFLAILVYWISENELTLSKTIIFNLCSTLLILIPILIAFKPSFKNLKRSLEEIWKKNKEYGIHYYTGSVFNQTTYRLDELFIAFFHNTILVGYYSLANLICTPMILMSQSLSKSMFKRFANSEKIPKKVFQYNTVWLTTCIIGLGVLVLIFQKFSYSDYDFSKVLKYILPLSAAFFFQGLCSPYAFLAAKSLGKEIRNVAWAEAVLNIIGNLFLIPPFGIMGAIYSSIAAKLVHFLALRFYYQKYLREQGIA